MRKDFRHGLVIGKFYPPHAGHFYLIQTAARHCERVTVIAMAASHESIPLALRLAWLQEGVAVQQHVAVVGVIDDVPVDYDDPDIWRQHVDLMRLALSQMNPPPPVAVDAVFTSEAYGDELATHFDAAAVCLDQGRSLYPVSGTAVRQDPVANWDYLSDAVRSWLCLKVVVVGAESTGKTTLAMSLAARLQGRGGVWARTRWVPEYGREYSHNKLAIVRGIAQRQSRPATELGDLAWETTEFQAIAVQQREWERAGSAVTGPVLIADTDAFATGVWHERYVGVRSDQVDLVADVALPHRLYILTDLDSVPFEQDGLRDGEHVRAWMHRRFIERLDEVGAKWVCVRGGKDDYLQQALAHIDAHLETLWRFALPLEQRSVGGLSTG